MRSRQSPRRTKLTVDEFLNFAELVGRVHVVGSRDNAELLTRLWQQREQHPEMQLHVGTPRLIEQTRKPSEALVAIAGSQPMAPSVGGWHLFTETDAIAYELAWKLSRKDLTDARATELAMQHPIWPLASFIGTLRADALGRWLGEVRDPRWYVHAKDPDSTASLERYMGLWPSLQASLLTHNQKAASTTAGRRCLLTRDCWLPATDVELSQCDMEDPRHFLVRVVAARCPMDPVVGLVRASQMFTRFVRAIWLSQVSGYSLFDPRDFLRKEELPSFMEFAEASAR